MTTLMRLYIVDANAPEDVIYHDSHHSPYFVNSSLSFYDSNEDFGAWVRIGMTVLFFSSWDTRLSEIISEDAENRMVQWMDSYHTGLPQNDEYRWSQSVDNDKSDTPKRREETLAFLRGAIGKRLMYQVE